MCVCVCLIQAIRASQPDAQQERKQPDSSLSEDPSTSVKKEEPTDIPLSAVQAPPTGGVFSVIQVFLIRLEAEDLDNI